MKNLLWGVLLLAGGASFYTNINSGYSDDVYARAAEVNASAPAHAAESKTVTNNVVAYTTQNEEIAKSRRLAAESLSKFDARFRANKPGTYSVKFPLTQNGETEHIWLQVSEISSNHYVGRLANAPVNGKKYKRGQHMTVPRDHVEDWMIMHSGLIYGGYSARYMIKDLPADQRALYEDKFRDL